MASTHTQNNSRSSYTAEIKNNAGALLSLDLSEVKFEESRVSDIASGNLKIHNINIDDTPETRSAKKKKPKTKQEKLQAKLMEDAEKEVSKVVIEDKVSDVPCDKCGKMMVIKHGRYGDFLACPGYPECKNAKPIVEELDVDCPKCGGKVLVKRSKKGKKFFGCSNYPDCDFVSWNEPVKDKCEECGSYMVLKYSKTKGKYVQCSNSECGNIKIVEEKEKDN